MDNLSWSLRKYIYHITYISLAIMPKAFHRKKIQKKSEQAMDSARNPSPGLRTCKVEVRLWCLLLWRSCRTVDPIVWEALDVRLNMCLDVLGISSESKRGLRSNWYMEVSWNRGPQIIPILVGFSIINHPFLGTPMYGNPHIWLRIFPEVLGLHRSSRVAWHAPYFAHAHKLIWVLKKEKYD
jgi:hypothetical protein